VERVGIEDNFFELGGDSILSVRVVARARQAGLQFSPRHLFQHQTIASLTELVTQNASTPVSLEGDAPFTPIQMWFFESKRSCPDHYNQAVLLTCKQRLDEEVLERSLKCVTEHHEGLRSRFYNDGGSWRQGSVDQEPERLSVVYEMRGLSLDEARGFLSYHATRLQSSLNLATGPLLRAGLFRGREDRLLLIVHHLIVDGISWRILLEDLESVYQQLSSGQRTEMPGKSASFHEWAKALSIYAGEETVKHEYPHWMAQTRSAEDKLPLDLSRGSNTEGSARAITFELGAQETRELMQSLPRVFKANIQDVLLTALLMTISQWTGRDRLLVDLEGHGREEISTALDVSRTVGWFTALYPVVLQRKRGADLAGQLIAVRDTLLSVPNHGIGYGILRYLRSDSDEIRRQPPAEISFNYLGRFDATFTPRSLFSPDTGPVGPVHAPDDERQYVFDVNAVVAEGSLKMSWTYSSNLHTEEKVQQLVDNLKLWINRILALTRGKLSVAASATGAGGASLGSKTRRVGASLRASEILEAEKNRP
jgi:non-ribosomal peptide synthase protein (TIGR01720 family)